MTGKKSLFMARDIFFSQGFFERCQFLSFGSVFSLRVSGGDSSGKGPAGRTKVSNGINPNRRFWRWAGGGAVRGGSLLVAAFYLSACSCSGGRNRTDIEPIADMAKQKNIKPQEGGEGGGMLQRLPPEGARARNRSYYPYKGDPVRASRQLKNPLQLTPEVTARGELYYTRYCIYCHGTRGDGREGALVAPRMAVPPPSLLTDKVKAYSDGRIYHIIYNGQGLMGAYRIQLGANEQALIRYAKGKARAPYRGFDSIWAVVQYVRVLQRRFVSPEGGE